MTRPKRSRRPGKTMRPRAWVHLGYRCGDKLWPCETVAINRRGTAVLQAVVSDAWKAMLSYDPKRT